MSSRSRILIGTFSSLGGVICIGAGFATGAIPAIVAGVGLLIAGIACYGSVCRSTRPAAEPYPDPDDILGVIAWRLKRGI